MKKQQSATNDSLFDGPCLHVVAFLVGFAHAERLSRKGSVLDDGIEESTLVDRRQEQADVPLLASELVRDIRTVDIVHRIAFGD